jgi:hypothetical protein
VSDPIFTAWLEGQYAQARALAAESDRFTPHALDGSPPQRYVLTFRCNGLVRGDDGVVRDADRFAVGVWFPDDYARVAQSFSILTWLGPAHAFHPNISYRAPFVCVGVIAPGTPLVDLIYRAYEVITFQRLTVDERNALNPDACAWARRHLDRIPIDPRPLKRRTAALDGLVLTEESHP